MKTIGEFLIENKNHGYVSFRMPGHKGRGELFTKTGFGDFYQQMIKEDTSYAPERTVKEVADNYAYLYQVEHTELLVNGSTAGIIAAVLTCVPRGGKLILGRSSHDSVFAAMRLGDIQPVYMKTYDEVRLACEENPDAKAVLITSPTKYGECQDIGRIADIAHNYGMTLIVDQAHGAHLKFFDAVTGTRMAAEDLGADIVINSTHKNLLSFGGTGIMNVCSNRIDIEMLADNLKMVQTSSPSSLMLGSLDINERIIRKWGGDMVVSWMNDLRFAYQTLEAIRGVKVFSSDRFDQTKISISMAELGLSGTQLKAELESKGIMPLGAYGEYVLLLTGAGNNRSDYESMLKVVRNITNTYAAGAREIKPILQVPDFMLESEKLPIEKELVPLYKADGRVLYNPIITYPPGHPIACPGEVLDMEVITYLARAVELGESISGIDDEGQIYVGVDI